MTNRDNLLFFFLANKRNWLLLLNLFLDHPPKTKKKKVFCDIVRAPNRKGTVMIMKLKERKDGGCKEVTSDLIDMVSELIFRRKAGYPVWWIHKAISYHLLNCHRIIFFYFLIARYGNITTVYARLRDSMHRKIPTSTTLFVLYPMIRLL